MGWPKGRPRGPLSPEHLRKTRRRTPPPILLPPEVMAWWTFVHYSIRLRRWWIKNVDEVQITELSAKLAVQGPPTDPNLWKLYDVVIPVVLANSRLRGRSFKMNVGLLPTDKSAMRWLYLGEAAEKAFKEIYGPLLKQQFKIEDFATAAAMCPSAKAAQLHFSRCLSGPDALANPKPATVLTPGAMDWSRNRFRGAFNEYYEGDYAEQVRQKLRTIR